MDQNDNTNIFQNRNKRIQILVNSNSPNINITHNSPQNLDLRLYESPPTSPGFMCPSLKSSIIINLPNTIKNSKNPKIETLEDHLPDFTQEHQNQIIVIPQISQIQKIQVQKKPSGIEQRKSSIIVNQLEEIIQRQKTPIKNAQSRSQNVKPQIKKLNLSRKDQNRNVISVGYHFNPTLSPKVRNVKNQFNNQLIKNDILFGLKQKQKKVTVQEVPKEFKKLVNESNWPTADQTKHYTQDTRSVYASKPVTPVAIEFNAGFLPDVRANSRLRPVQHKSHILQIRNLQRDVAKTFAKQNIQNNDINFEIKDSQPTMMRETPLGANTQSTPTKGQKYFMTSRNSKEEGPMVNFKNDLPLKSQNWMGFRAARKSQNSNFNQKFPMLGAMENQAIFPNKIIN